MCKDPVLQVDKLSKVYDGNIILNNINLEINEGQIIILIGKNGSGKSVLLRCLYGVEPVSEGDVFLNGKNVNDRINSKLHSSLISSEHIEHLNLLKQKEYLDFIIQIYKLPFEESRKKIEVLSKELGIEGFHNELIGNLSYGTKKKLQFMASILYKPKIIFGDELFEGLDVSSVDKVIELIHLYAYKGNAFIITSHIKEVEKKLNGYTYILENRQIHKKK